MDKTTKAFVIGACAVVIGSGVLAVGSTALSAMSRVTRQATASIERQQRYSACKKLQQNALRNSYNWSGNADWRRCIREFGNPMS